MAPRLNYLFSAARAASRRVKIPPQRSFVSLPVDTRVEEETLPHYDPQHFYPVHIGEIFNKRYRIAGKLGYGTYSTSWLCRDLQMQSYAVLKVSTSLPKFPTATDREWKVYEHLKSVESDHPGQSLLRKCHDAFELKTHGGNFRCLVLEPMHMTLLDTMGLNPEPFNLPLLKMTLRRLLTALDFLHTDANVIHTDIKTDNLILSLMDDSMLTYFEEEEARNPSPRKTIDQLRTIYTSRKFRRPGTGKGFGLPMLCDFGEARVGNVQESGPFVQPSIYRPPEVIFEMPWGSTVDMWNLGALIWDLFEGRHLFGDIFDEKGNHDPFKHLALMVSLIGPPPADFVRRSETAEQCFDSNGAWIAHEHARPPSTSLEHLEWRLSGTEKEDFLRFLRSMLRWLPEERKSAKQLLEDPWLVEHD